LLFQKSLALKSPDLVASSAMKAFFSALWNFSDLGKAGCLALWGLPGRRSVHAPLAELTVSGDEEWSQLFEHYKGKNLYFGTASRREGLRENQRGTKRDCVLLPAFTLDIDMKAEEGTHAAENLPSTLGEVDQILGEDPPPSAVIHTGNGLHLYWFLSEPLDVSSKAKADAVGKRIKAWQARYIERAKALGWVLDATHSVDRVWRVPGSQNVKTDPPKPVELLHCNASLRYSPFELCDVSSQNPPPSPEPPDAPGIPPDLESKMKASTSYKEEFRAILAGRPFAEEGERDTKLQKLASVLAWMDQGASQPKALAEVLRPSLSHWDDEDWVAKAVDKIERAQGDLKAKKQADDRLYESLQKAQPKPPKAGSAKKHLALQMDNTFYIFDFKTGEYRNACTNAELPLVLRDAWAASEDCPVEWLTKGDKPKKKNKNQLLEEYGTVIEEAQYDFSSTKAVFDAGQRFLVVPCGKLRDLQPLYNPKIQEWLELIPSKKSMIGPFLDWISVITLLQHQCAGLYLSGAKAVGKSLFAGGLATLWFQGPTKLANVFARFNASLLSCPFVHLDEAWHNPHTNMAAELRQLVGTKTHQIERKGKPVVTAKGSVRLLITANSNAVLNVRGNGYMNGEEISATAERILHVAVAEKAGEYLKEIPEHFSWIDDFSIAKHALWLRDERALSAIDRARKAGRRFVVEGDPNDPIYGNMGASERDLEAILEWFVKWIQCEDKNRLAKVGSLASMGGGEIKVTTRAIRESWQVFGLDKNHQKPQSRTIGRVLKALSKSSQRVNVGHLKGYDVNVIALVAKLEDLDLLTEKEVKERVR
jgi:hypothetical protein